MALGMAWAWPASESRACQLIPRDGMQRQMEDGVEKYPEAELSPGCVTATGAAREREGGINRWTRKQ